jgi:hypothetical protein
MANIGYLIDENGDLILDDSGNPIPKDSPDVRGFPRSEVKAEDVEPLLLKLRNEVLRRSGFKTNSNGEPIFDDNGDPIPLMLGRYDLSGNRILDDDGNWIPIGVGRVSGPVMNPLGDYNATEFEKNSAKVAEGKKIMAESGNQLLDRLLFICELFNKRLTKYPAEYENIPKGFDTEVIDAMLNKLRGETMFDSRTSCRSMCTGLCVGSCGSSCSDKCYATCIGCSHDCKSICAKSCGDSCRNECNIECFSTCKEVCRTTCIGSCKSTCTTACVNGCKTTCGGDCVDGCSSCTGHCRGCTACTSCTGSCSGSGCKTTCNTQCTTGCTGSCGGNATGVAD